ncbi:hypothetical protein L7F22_064866 [Adiantum nelumboides]|nr:hypothetical protein [Adiantum nelumboides]
MEEVFTATTIQGLRLHQIQLQHIIQISSLKEEEAITIKDQEEEAMEDGLAIVIIAESLGIGKGIEQGVEGHKLQMDHQITRYQIMHLQVQIHIMKKLSCLLTWFIFKKKWKMGGDDSHHAIQGKGTITIQMSQGEEKDLSNVLLVPGHISHQSIMHLKKEGLDEGLQTFQVNEEPNLCPSCQFGKQQRRRFNKSTYRARQPLELIHSDVWGPSQTTSMGGPHYFLTFVDDMSRKVWVYFLKNKSEVFSYFKQSKAMVEKECGRFIKTLRSDQGGEFRSKEFEELCWNQGIRRQYTCAYTPQQNGVAERKNRVIVEHARAMLNEGNLPKLYWAKAVNTSVHLMNMSPTEALTRLTREEAYSGIKPNVSTLKVFGCVAYMHIPDEKRRKLDVKSERCVFTGYDMYSKGYRLVNPDTNKIHISRDVIFDESDRWFKNTSSSYEEVSM